MTRLFVLKFIYFSLNLEDLTGTITWLVVISCSKKSIIGTIKVKHFTLCHTICCLLGRVFLGNRFHDKLDFKQFWNVEEDREGYNWEHVRCENSSPRINPFAFVVIFNRTPDSPISFLWIGINVIHTIINYSDLFYQSQCHCDVNRTT